MSDAAVLIPNVPMTEEMRRIGREQAIRTSHMLAVQKLEQALETRARADTAVKEAVQQLDKVLERERLRMEWCPYRRKAMKNKERPSIYCGNFKVIVESYGRAHFEEAMRMCFDAHSTATHYSIDGNGLHLFWSGSAKEAKPLPYEMKADAAIEFVWGWLQTADRGPEPGHDGSNRADGFRIESRDEGWSYAIASITAVWSEFHK